MFILSQKYRCEELITIRGEGQVCLSDCQMGGIKNKVLSRRKSKAVFRGMCLSVYM